jgi:hypothetical protein
MPGILACMSGLNSTVRFSGSGGGFAYRPGELIIDRSALDELIELTGLESVASFDIGPTLILVTGVPGELAIAAALRARGRRAQANHVVFAAAELHAEAAMFAMRHGLLPDWETET